MSKAITYPVGTFGFLILGFGVIRVCEDQFGMRIGNGPMAAIMVGLLLVAGGVLWQTYLGDLKSPATAPAGALPHAPAASVTTTPAPPNKSGDLNQ
jgi:hypothetical protein